MGGVARRGRPRRGAAANARRPLTAYAQESARRAPVVPKGSRRRARIVRGAATPQPSAPHSNPHSAAVRKLDGAHQLPQGQ